MIDVPEHLIVGEPELKWCESICKDLDTSSLPENVTIHRLLYGPKPARWEYRAELLRRTNMAEIRVDRALNLLYHANRI